MLLLIFLFLCHCIPISCIVVNVSIKVPVTAPATPSLVLEGDEYTVLSVTSVVQFVSVENPNKTTALITSTPRPTTTPTPISTPAPSTDTGILWATTGVSLLLLLSAFALCVFTQQKTLQKRNLSSTITLEKNLLLEAKPTIRVRIKSHFTKGASELTGKDLSSAPEKNPPCVAKSQ